jgi:peptidoglycan/LPS O-acetylase OafA/YrhL
VTKNFPLVGAESRLMQFATKQIDPDWRSRIDKRLTSLRGCAALTVMLAHYQYIGFLSGAPVFKYSGQWALMVFFFLSSFLLSHSLASDPNWSFRPSQSLVAYAINRILRIIPLLAAVIALTTWNRLSFFPPSTGLFEAMRLSLTLGEAPSVLWTMPVELIVYVYLPFILALALRATRSRLGGATLSTAYLGWCAAIALARHEGLSPSPWMTLGSTITPIRSSAASCFMCCLQTVKSAFRRPRRGSPYSRRSRCFRPLRLSISPLFATIPSWPEWRRPGPGNPITTAFSQSRRSSSAEWSTAFCTPPNPSCLASCG